MDKKYNKQAIKDMLYGTVKELSDNNDFYYRGVSDHFSHLTPEGREQVHSLIERMIPIIHAYEDEDFQERAINSTFSLLKDEEK